MGIPGGEKPRYRTVAFGSAQISIFLGQYFLLILVTRRWRRKQRHHRPSSLAKAAVCPIVPLPFIISLACLWCYFQTSGTGLVKGTHGAVLDEYCEGGLHRT